MDSVFILDKSTSVLSFMAFFTAALTGPALKVWKHIPVVTSSKGRSVLSLGYRAAPVTIKKQPKEQEAKTKVAAAHASTAKEAASVATAAHTRAAYLAVKAA